MAQHRKTTRAQHSLSLQVQARKSSDVTRVDVLSAFDALGKDSDEGSRETTWRLFTNRTLEEGWERGN